MRTLTPLLALALLMAAATQSGAVTRHVPSEYPSIQAALNASTDGDLVLVAAGTYFEHLHLSFADDGVTLASAPGANSPSSTAVIPTCGSSDRRRSRTRIEGSTLTNGRAEPSTPNNIGGGVRLDSADLTLVDNMICNISRRRLAVCI